MKLKHITPTVLLPTLLLVGCSLSPRQQASMPASDSAPANTVRAAEAITVAIQPTASASASPTPSTAASSASPSAEVTATEIRTPASAQPAPSDEHTITIDAPAAGATITSPVVVGGDASFWPFEGMLTGVIKDANGVVLGTAPLPVQSPGTPAGGPWEAQITFDAPAGTTEGTLDVYAASPKDGAIVAIETLPVRFGTTQPAETQPPSPVQLDAPQPVQDVTLPVHVALRVSPSQQVAARLVYSNGAVLEAPVPVVTGSDGVGYGVLNLQWSTEGPPPTTVPGAATLEIVNADGSVLTQSTVNVLPNDATQSVRVAWRAGNEIIEQQQQVPPTQAIGAAALNELLNGPVPRNLVGAGTALPSTEEIVTWSGRDATWGYRVQLLGLAIEDGVATVNFSKELRAYGGGAARAQQIREQIERTLQQFPSVERVVVEIDGDSSAATIGSI
jgi:hypothetical protein